MQDQDGQNNNIRSPNIVRVIKLRRLRWTGHVARMEEGRSGFKILTSKPTGKRPLWRPRRRWEDNFRMDLKEIGINTRNGIIWLRIGIIGEPLWKRHWTFGFHRPWSYLVRICYIILEICLLKDFLINFSFENVF